METHYSAIHNDTLVNIAHSSTILHFSSMLKIFDSSLKLDRVLHAWVLFSCMWYDKPYASLNEKIIFVFRTASLECSSTCCSAWTEQHVCLYRNVGIHTKSSGPNDVYMREWVNYAIIGSHNGVSPVQWLTHYSKQCWHQSIWPQGTNSSEMLIELWTFLLKKCIWNWYLKSKS